MASMPHYQWDSAPPVMQRGMRDRGHSSPGWLNNAKEALLKPWKQRAQRRKNDSKQTPNRQDEYVYNRNPFAPRQNVFAPGGGMPKFGGPFSNMAQFNQLHIGGQYKSPMSAQQEPSSDLPKGYFEPESIPYKQTRPSLKSVFPMYDSPQLSHTPEISIAAMRRNSTPGGAVYFKPVITPTDEPRRPTRSSESSVISNERSDRRERRANMMRDIPVLPNMSGYNAYNQTPSHHQQYTCNNASQVHPRQDTEFSHTPYSPNHSMQRRPELHNSFSFPPWPDPHKQLQELEEELDVDEIDGSKELKLLYEADKKRKSEKAHKKIFRDPRKLRHIQEESGSETDIKGFDQFMMY